MKSNQSNWYNTLHKLSVCVVQPTDVGHVCVSFCLKKDAAKKMLPFIIYHNLFVRIGPWRCVCVAFVKPLNRLSIECYQQQQQQTANVSDRFDFNSIYAM